MGTSKSVLKNERSNGKLAASTSIRVIHKDSCIQGKNANFTGKKFEDKVEDIIVAKGVVPIPYTKWVNNKISIPDGVTKILFKQVAYTKLWGTTGRNDFKLVLPKGRSVRIDVRCQATPGSVEEKICYLFETAVHCYPNSEVIIILDGLGVRPSIRKWIEGKAQAIKHKSIKVMTLSRFREWVNTNI